MLTKQSLIQALTSFLSDEADKSDPRVLLLQEFMAQEAILALPETDSIDWSRFINFVATKGQDSLFDRFDSASKVDELFLSFKASVKGNGHFDHISTNPAEIIADFLGDPYSLGVASQLSRGSRGLFATSAESAKKKKFLELGIQSRVVDQLFTTHRVRGLDGLYRKLKQFFRRPRFDDLKPFPSILAHLSESIEALIIFSGELESLDRYFFIGELESPDRHFPDRSSLIFSSEFATPQNIHRLEFAVWSGSVPVLKAIWAGLESFGDECITLMHDTKKALTHAIKSGSVAMFEECRSKLRGLEGACWSGDTASDNPLFDAADSGSADMLRALGRGHVALRSPSELDSLLCRVARSGSLSAMLLITETWGIKPSSHEVLKEMLAQAALSGSKEMTVFALAELLKKMKTVPSPLYCGQDLVYFAARSGSVGVMEFASRHVPGIAPNVLGAAVRSGSVEAVEFALKEWRLTPVIGDEYPHLHLERSDGVSLTAERVWRCRVSDWTSSPFSLVELAESSRNPRMIEVVDSLLVRDHHPELPQAAGAATGPRA